MAPGVLERILSKAHGAFDKTLESRLLAGQAYNEDAAVLEIPQGLAIVQSADILAPIVNDARGFGRIAAANAMSDIYAMGGQPWCCMNLAFFPPALAENDAENTLVDIIEGALDCMAEAGAVCAGGHTVQDEELKFGLSVTGIIEPGKIARNDGLHPGQILILSKPLGVGILATAIKAHWDYASESEEEITHWCGKLNSIGAKIIPTLGLTAATDVTGFGLGGHACEMARASNVSIEISTSVLPLMKHTLEYALDGLIPAGTHANERFFGPSACREGEVDKAFLSIIFDAQTSGGLLLAVAEDQLEEASEMLLASGNLAAVIGRVNEMRADGKLLLIHE